MGRSLVVRRIFEVIGVEMLLAATATAMSFVNMYSGKKSVFFVAVVMNVIYLIWTVYCLFNFRVILSGKGRYYLINAPIYLLLFSGAIGASFLDTDGSYPYTFFFMPLKLFHYAAESGFSFPGKEYVGSRPVSAALVSAIIAIPVIFMPLIISTKRKYRMRGLAFNKRKTDEKK